MLKKLDSVFCDPADVLAWEVVKYYSEYMYYSSYSSSAMYKIVLHVKNNLTFELKIKPDYKTEDQNVDISNGFWRRLFRRPVKTDTVKHHIIIKSAQEKAEELMKEFLNE